MVEKLRDKEEERERLEQEKAALEERFRQQVEREKEAVRSLEVELAAKEAYLREVDSKKAKLEEDLASRGDEVGPGQPEPSDPLWKALKEGEGERSVQSAWNLSFHPSAVMVVQQSIVVAEKETRKSSK